MKDVNVNNKWANDEITQEVERERKEEVVEIVNTSIGFQNIYIAYRTTIEYMFYKQNKFSPQDSRSDKDRMKKEINVLKSSEYK